MELLPEAEEDGRRAKLVEFGSGEIDNEPGSRAVFRTPRDLRDKPRPTKPAKDNRADVLRKQLLRNTRALMNPFGDDKAAT